MSIDAVCPDCGSTSQFDEGRTGQLTQCPICQALFVPTSQVPGRADAEPSLVEILNEAAPAPETQTDATTGTTTATATALTETPTPTSADGCAHCQEARLKGETVCSVCGLGLTTVSSSPAAPAPVAQPPQRGFFAPPDKARARLLNQMAQDDEDVEDEPGGFFGPEKRGIAKGMLGGIIMMVIAAVWFFWGLSAGYYYFYPPVLFLIGGYAFAKGLATGNFFGNR